MDIFGKQNFAKNLKHLKEYNEKRPSTTKYVYFPKHLPIEQPRQKKKLIPFAKKPEKRMKRQFGKLSTVSIAYLLTMKGCMSIKF